jgi:D-alanyl-D-alanine dipeptidase
MNKILQQFWILKVLGFFILPSNIIHAQNKYGVSVIDNKDSYKRSIAQDSTKMMVELKTIVPNIVYEIRYATSNNFARKRMYTGNIQRTFLRKPAAEALAKVQEELKSHGLGIKVFDAYRPYSVSVKFWELIKDEKYVANPAKGSSHNRGLAIDLTLIDLKTKRDLEMGTNFDNFSDSAHHSYEKLKPEIKQNRKLLRDIMKKHGFEMLDTEWWHYSWPNINDYELLDLKL